MTREEKYRRDLIAHNDEVLRILAEFPADTAAFVRRNFQLNLYPADFAREWCAKVEAFKRDVLAPRDATHRPQPVSVAASYRSAPIVRDKVMAWLDWRPIDTAPKDGTAVLVWDGYDLMVSRFGACGVNEWSTRALCAEEPTHWIPLPEPPDAD